MPTSSGVAFVLAKPFRAADVLRRVRDALRASLTTTALVDFPPQAEYVSCIQPGHRQITDVADYPAERFAVSRDGGGRAPHLVTRPLYKRGSAIPMVIDGRSSSPEALCLRSGGVVTILTKEVLVCLNGVMAAPSPT